MRDGLVAKLGQDRVQQIIADAFRPVREALGDFDIVPDESPDFDQYEGLTGTFRAACIAADRAIAERKRNAPPGKPRDERAAQSTVEAVAYALRTDGAEALKREDTRARLLELSPRQLESLVAALAKLRGTYPRVTDGLLLLLAELLP